MSRNLAWTTRFDLKSSKRETPKVSVVLEKAVDMHLSPDLIA
jgi:hypothetical protein